MSESKRQLLSNFVPRCELKALKAFKSATGRNFFEVFFLSPSIFHLTIHNLRVYQTPSLSAAVHGCPTGRRRALDFLVL